MPPNTQTPTYVNIISVDKQKLPDIISTVIVLCRSGLKDFSERAIAKGKAHASALEKSFKPERQPLSLITSFYVKWALPHRSYARFDFFAHAPQSDVEPYYI